MGCEYAERLREYEDNGGTVVAVSAGEFMGGTRGSGGVSSADDVLEMSVVHGVGGVWWSV